MSDLVFYSDTELPHQFLSRAARMATDRHDDEMANLFYGFCDMWRPQSRCLSFVAEAPAMSWRDAKFTQSGRAVMALAARFTDVQDSKEVK